jgi:hypothetical protein
MSQHVPTDSSPAGSEARALQGGEQLVDARVQRVGIRLANADDVPLVEDEEGAGAHALLLAVHAILPCDSTSRLTVGQQREVELRVAGKGCVPEEMVAGDAEQSRRTPRRSTASAYAW